MDRERDLSGEAGIPASEGPREAESRTPPSAVLARLIAEVRNEGAEVPNAYNRMHNRHNRSR